LINFRLFGLFGLSDLEKSKSNQRIKTELAEIFKPKTESNSLKFNVSIQTRFVCTPLNTDGRRQLSLSPHGTFGL
jgi:hypothetical protein